MLIRVTIEPESREFRHECVIPAQPADMTSLIDGRFDRGIADAYGQAYETMSPKRIHQVGFAYLSGDRRDNGRIAASHARADQSPEQPH
jgi:hypothetical protein